MRSEPCDFETMGDVGENLLVTFDMVTEKNIHQEHQLFCTLSACFTQPKLNSFEWTTSTFIQSTSVSLRQEVLMTMTMHFCLGVCDILVWYVATDIYGKPVYSFVRSLLPCTLTYSRSCKLHVLWPKKSTVSKCVWFEVLIRLTIKNAVWRWKQNFSQNFGKFVLDYMRLYYSPEDSIFLIGNSYPPPITLYHSATPAVRKKNTCRRSRLPSWDGFH